MTAITGGTGAAHARIMGVGAYRPSRLVPNSEVVDAIDSSDEWIQQRSGIKTRRFAGDDETVVSMAVAASRQAIEQAGLDVADIDCVIVATVSHLMQTPSAATAIAHELGTDKPAAFDISAACAGFCHGVALGNDAVRGGSARYALVIGVEKLSSLAFFLAMTALSLVFLLTDGPKIRSWVSGHMGVPRDVGTVAWEIGLSARQLRRRCLDAFGYPPKTLARILRLTRVSTRRFMSTLIGRSVERPICEKPRRSSASSVGSPSPLR